MVTFSIAGRMAATKGTSTAEKRKAHAQKEAKAQGREERRWGQEKQQVAAKHKSKTYLRGTGQRCIRPILKMSREEQRQGKHTDYI